MSDQNPYTFKEPAADADPLIPEDDHYDLGAIARHLRFVAWSVIALVSATACVVLSDIGLIAEQTQQLFGHVGLFAYLAVMLSGLLVIMDVSNDRRSVFVLGILMFAPCIGLFVVGGVCQHAFDMLKQHGSPFRLFR